MKKQTSGRKALKSTKTDWHFNHIVQDATEKQMDRIWDAFIVAVEKEGLCCGGSLHQLGLCQACKDDKD